MTEQYSPGQLASVNDILIFIGPLLVYARGSLVHYSIVSDQDICSEHFEILNNLGSDFHDFPGFPGFPGIFGFPTQIGEIARPERNVF
jgi:hypothetical protein